MSHDQGTINGSKQSSDGRVTISTEDGSGLQPPQCKIIRISHQVHPVRLFYSIVEGTARKRWRKSAFQLTPATFCYLRPMKLLQQQNSTPTHGREPASQPFLPLSPLYLPPFLPVAPVESWLSPVEATTSLRSFLITPIIGIMRGGSCEECRFSMRQSNRRSL